jgi:hypothetical protein
MPGKRGGSSGSTKDKPKTLAQHKADQRASAPKPRPRLGLPPSLTPPPSKAEQKARTRAKARAAENARARKEIDLGISLSPAERLDRYGWQGAQTISVFAAAERDYRKARAQAQTDRIRDFYEAMEETRRVRAENRADTRAKATIFGYHSPTLGFGVDIAKGLGAAGEVAANAAGRAVAPLVRPLLFTPPTSRSAAGMASAYTPPVSSITKEEIGKAALAGTLGLGKVGAAGAAGLVGIPAHPIRSLQETGTIVMSIGDVAGVIASPSLTPEEKYDQIEGFVQAAIDDIVSRYGPKVTFEEAIRRGYNEPVISVLNAAAVASPAVRAASILRFMTKGASFRDARKLSRDPSRAPELINEPYKPRTLTVRGHETKPYQVEVNESRNPLVRGIGRGRDKLSKVIDLGLMKAPGGKYVPIVGETKRALRVERQRDRRMKTRLRADGEALFRSVLRETNNDPVLATRLFYGMQMPEGVDEATFLGAIVRDFEQMLAGREQIMPDKVSAAERKLRNRLATFRARTDRATMRRWQRRVDTIAEALENSRESIAAVNEDIRQLRDEARVTLEDPDMPEAQKAKAIEHYEAYISSYESLRERLREEIAPLEADLEDVDSPARDDLLAKIAQTNVDPEQAQDLIAWFDQRARTWAKQKEGRDPGDWYDDPEGLGAVELNIVDDLTELPKGALAQRRPRDVSQLTVERLREHVFDGVDLSVFREHNIDEFLQNIPDYLRRGEPYKEWYESSGKRILELANNDREQAARFAQIVAIYSASRKPVENINLAVQAILEWQETGKITVSKITNWKGKAEGRPKPRDQADKAMQVMRGEDWGGRKTNRFYANMLKWIDPARYEREFPGGEVTNDIWMARLFGLKSDVPTPREYDQMTKIQQNIAEMLGWAPEEIQAALWVPAKADAGRTVTGPGGKKMRVKLEDDEAGIDFAQALEQESATVPIEAAPGRRVPGQEYLRRYDDLAPDQKLAYTRDKMEAVRDFLGEARVLGRVRAEGVGLFKNETNPAFTLEIPAPGMRADLGGGKQAARSTTAREGQAALTDVISMIGRALNQDAMAWFRPFHRREPITMQNGVRLDLTRRLTEEETLLLNRTLRERLGGDVALPPAPNDGVYVLNFSGAKNRVFQETVKAVLDEIAPDLGYHTGTFRFDGDYRTRSRYARTEQTTGFAGRSHVREADDRLRSRSDAIDRRYFGDPDDPAGVALGAEGVGGKPHLLAQTRHSDILGAVQWLDSETGRRIIYMSREADASTWVHELIGHGVREMKASYAREWKAVEDYVGRPLEEWDRADHERFATWTERYAANGKAPTPELVPAFQRMKQWMRAIYGGIREVGPPLPPSVEALMHAYFGAYDDEQVFRVAQVQTRIPEDQRVSEDGTIFRFTGQELAALRQRNSTRAFNRSAAGIRKKINAAYERYDELSDAEIKQLTADEAQYMTLRGEEDAVKEERTKNLRNRIGELEAALADLDNPAYSGALITMQELARQREEILRGVFGDKYDAVFSNRVDLLADWLVDRGLLAPGFARGTAHYMPHVSTVGRKEPRRIDVPARALESDVIGRVDTSTLNMHKRNNMIRWQNGDVLADPIVMFEAWQNAQAFAFLRHLKDKLWDIGRPLRRGENLAELDVYVINKNGIPTRNLRREDPGPSTTPDSQNALDAFDGQDVRSAELLLREYAAELLMTPERLQQHLDDGMDPAALDLRIVDTRIINTLFRPLRGGGSAAGQGWDILNSLARWSLIYANVPSYIAMNLLGNLFFLGAQQPAAMISNLIRAAKMGLTDPEIRGRVAAQTGQIQPIASVARGRGGSKKWRGREQKALHAIGLIPDTWPRMASWIYEARRMGYRSRADMIRLLDGKSEHLARNRDLISERATEMMVNFERGSEWERQAATRALFIWPWIRGATAWPFYYAKEMPGRAAIAANVGLAAEEQREEMLGPVPSYRRNLFPVSTNGNVASVINVGPVSPGGTAGESIRTLVGQAESIVNNEPLPAGEQLGGYLSPLYQAAIELATAKTSFGQPQSPGDWLLENGLDFVPFGTFGYQMLVDPEFAQSKTYIDRSKRGIAARKFIRIHVQDVSIAKLNAAAEAKGAKTTSQKIAEETDKVLKRAREVGFKGPLPRRVTESIKWKQEYLDMREQFKEEVLDRPGYKKLAGRTLSPAEELELSYAYVRKQAPGLLEAYPPMNKITNPDIQDLVADALLYGNKTYGLTGIFQPLTNFQSNVSAVKEAAG